MNLLQVNGEYVLVPEKIVNSIPSVFVSSITRLQICEKQPGLFCQASKSGSLSGFRCALNGCRAQSALAGFEPRKDS